MNRRVTRRSLLAGSLAATATAALPRPVSAQAPSPAKLVIARRMIEVNREPASVFGITRDGGKPGLVLEPGERFRVTLENRAGLPSLIHWHGQTPPPAQGQRS